MIQCANMWVEEQRLFRWGVDNGCVDLKCLIVGTTIFSFDVKSLLCLYLSVVTVLSSFRPKSKVIAKILQAPPCMLFHIFIYGFFSLLSCVLFLSQAFCSHILTHREFSLKVFSAVIESVNMHAYACTWTNKQLSAQLFIWFTLGVPICIDGKTLTVHCRSCSSSALFHYLWVGGPHKTGLAHTSL